MLKTEEKNFYNINEVLKLEVKSANEEEIKASELIIADIELLEIGTTFIELQLYFMQP